jgi:hypothetical protein
MSLRLERYSKTFVRVHQVSGSPPAKSGKSCQLSDVPGFNGVKNIRVYVFSVLLYLLLWEHLEEQTQAIMEPEYPGFEPVIKKRGLALSRRDEIRVEKDQLAFVRVGKKSPAHKLTYRVYRGIDKPNRVDSASDVPLEFWK